MIPLSCKFEDDLVAAGDDEAARAAAEEAAGAKSALPKIIKTGYHRLNLIHFFTAGADEVKCWTIRKGQKAPAAAGTIHTDFEQGFICADVVSYDDLHEFGSEAEAKKNGKLRMEGKNYVVQDGDVCHFKFNLGAKKKK